MLDWLTVKLDHAHKPINAGRVIAVKPDGSVEWETVKAQSVKGSYESKIQVRSLGALDKQGRATVLQISGNPAKFLQGHNIFGNEDITAMLTAVLRRLDSSLGIGCVSPFVVASGVISRLDFTKSLQFDCLSSAQAYIRQVGLKAKTRNGRPTITGHTLTFQKSSRRWSLVVYSKGDEVMVHKLPEEIPCRDRLISEAQSLVRVELRLRGKELDKLNMRRVSQCAPTQLNEVYKTYVQKIEMSTQTQIVEDIVMQIPPAYRASYLLWYHGADIASQMKRATFYRHRSKLKGFGIDISVPRDIDNANIVPIHRVIDGRPYEVPQWAKDEGLIFGIAA